MNFLNSLMADKLWELIINATCNNKLGYRYIVAVSCISGGLGKLEYYHNIPQVTDKPHHMNFEFQIITCLTI
jgi:hypothetical protein